jgi:hypothetical protein
VQNSPGWLTSVDISNDSTTAIFDPNRRQDLGVDEDSNAFAIWTILTEVFASRFDAATQTWSSDVKIGDILSVIGSTPALSVTKDGKAIAIWSTGANGALLYYNVYDGGWGTAAVVPQSQSFGSNLRPSIGVDNLGHAIAVWAVTYMGGGEGSTVSAIESLVFDFSSKSWGSLAKLDEVSTGFPAIFVSDPIIAVNDKGDAYAVWRYVSEDVIPFFNEIRAPQYLGSSGWSSTIETIAMQDEGSPNSLFLVDPIVAIDPNSNALAIWVLEDLTGLGLYNVLSSYRPSGTNWPTSVITLSQDVNKTVGPTNQTANYFTDVAFDMNGDAVGVWPTNFGAGIGIQGGAFDHLTQSWSKTIISNPNTLATLPRVAVQANGNAWATWSEASLSPLSANTMAAKFIKSSASGESTPETLSTRTVNLDVGGNLGVSGSSVATNSIGCYFADWPSSDNTDINNPGPYFVQASRTPCSFGPQNLRVCQRKNRFLIQTKYYNVLTWTPAPSSNIKGYKIYRNGQQIAFVNSTTYCDHNQCPCVRTTYQVVAIDTNDNASSPTTFVLR